MLQEIEPKRLFNEYRHQEPLDTDYVVMVHGTKVAGKVTDNEMELPRVSMLTKDRVKLIYLLSVDEQGYFYLPYEEEHPILEEYPLTDRMFFREKQPKDVSFAATVGFHIGAWYETNRFCGCCGSAFEHSKTERAMVCPKCHNTKYPQISPAVIVGIINKDKILLSKYVAGNTKRYSLIAGYCEAGETVEQTIEREVMEETGLRVKNPKYFTSQPWPFTSTLLMGFFVELDGDDSVSLDDRELSEATWFDREHLPKTESTLSMTWTMIEYFRNHRKLDVVGE